MHGGKDPIKTEKGGKEAKEREQEARVGSLGRNRSSRELRKELPSSSTVRLLRSAVRLLASSHSLSPPTAGVRYRRVSSEFRMRVRLFSRSLATSPRNVSGAWALFGIYLSHFPRAPDFPD